MLSLRGIKSISFLLALALLGISPSLINAGSHEAIVEAAKKERTLALYTSMTVDQMQTILNTFKSRYPFIEPKMFRAVGERLLTKIMTVALS